MEDRQEWLSRRRKGIGSSDAPGIVLRRGEHRGVFRTPLEIYLDKIDALPAQSSTGTDPMSIGTLLEANIVTLFERATGLEALPSPGVQYSAQHPWMLCNPDRLTLEGEALIEAKNSSSYDGWGLSGTDNIPEGYLIQVQHQLAVMGLSVCYVAALLGGSTFRWYKVRRHESLIEQMIALEEAFWERVQRLDPPPPDYTEPGTAKLLDLLYRPEQFSECKLPSEAISHLDEYQEATRQVAEHKRRQKQARAHLTALMGHAEVAYCADGRKITRTLVRRKEYTVKATEYVLVRVTGDVEDSEE